MYAGGNRVFRTQDEGASWTAISPDLSLNEPNRQGHSGGELTHDTAGAEVHATCACVAPSPHREQEIWASTDDGLVHVTRNNGQTWKNVTPKDMPKLAYVGCIEISHQNADLIYVSATRYKLGDYSPTYLSLKMAVRVGPLWWATCLPMKLSVLFAQILSVQVCYSQEQRLVFLHPK